VQSLIPPHRVVVMGVSGCGKSTVAAALAQRIHARYVEGDALHPTRNVEKMAAGVALNDDDRAPWLLRIADELSQARQANQALVVTCSALKRKYRDVLRQGASDVRFVHLHGDVAVLEQRMQARQGHYMPASLLKSQLATLEPPGEDESPIVVDVAHATEAQVQSIVDRLPVAKDPS
jgi:carbohydrate kinase (thermoresistant glucokinase family)